MLNQRVRIRSPGALMVGLAMTFVLVGVSGSVAAQTSFLEDVFPIIQIRCLSCHQPGGEGHEASGLDLRTYDGLMAGTKFGPMVVPGDVIASNLLTLIDGRAQIHMPYNRKPLSKCERLTFRAWVQQGALNN